MTKKQFIERMQQAVTNAIAKGAKVHPAVVVAQAALESNWGNSGLAKKASNLFGIKAGKSWFGPTLDLPTKEFSKERGWYKTVTRWRKYGSWTECVLDYANLIRRLPWFQDALAHLGSADHFLKALMPDDGQPGWATDPRYFSKVKAVGALVEKLGGPKWA